MGFGLFISLSCLLTHVSAVLNGVPSNYYETRSMVLIYSRFPNIPDGQAMICGGVFIAPNVVLTAGHCVKDDNAFPSVVTVAMSSDSPSELGRTKMQSTRAIDLHSRYSESVRGNEDMALLYLPSSINCKSLSGPHVARLPPWKQDNSPQSLFKVIMESIHPDKSKDPITDQEIETALCFAAGSGMTKDGTYSNTPQNIYLRLRREDPDSLFGFPHDPLARACKGDSGSPVYCYIRGIKYMIGVMTDVGTYREIQHRDDDEMRCEDYDFVVISDIRANMAEIKKILNKRGLSDTLATGQRLCHNIL